VRLAAASGRVENVVEFCREQGIARSTFYRWRARYRDGGLAGLEERSRRPLSAAPLMGSDVEDRIVQLRKQLTDAGPASIHDYLVLEGWELVPSVSSIWRGLHRRGFITAQPNKRPRSSFKSFVYDRPNECWQIDDTQWQLADGTVVFIVEIIDDHSRVCVASHAVESPTTQAAWAVFTDAAGRWGLPQMVLSDNGTAYNMSRRGTTVAFEANLRTLGINPVASTPRHPQTCGKVERFHQTTKKWLRTKPKAATVEELNSQLAVFVDFYNNKRPHRSLDGNTPATIHHQNPKAAPVNQPITAPKRITKPHVTPDGNVWSRPWKIGVDKTHAGQQVTCIIDGDHAYIFNKDTLIRELTLDQNKTKRLYRVP